MQRQGHLIQQRGVRVAQQGDRGFVVDPGLRGPGHQLVQYGEGVTHRSSAGADHQRQHALGHLDVLTFAEGLQVLQQGLGRNQAERVVVGTRADRADDLVRFGGREDELDVGRRLFNDFQQGVESCRGNHVGLIDDEDLVPVAGRGKSCTFAKVAGVFDAAVAGRVDLDDVKGARAAAGQFNAAVAFAARGRRRAFGTVQAACQDAGAGGLAAAAGPGKEVGVIDPVLRQGSHQGGGHVLLPDNVGEGVGTISTVKRCTHTDTLSVLRCIRHQLVNNFIRPYHPRLPGQPGRVKGPQRGVERAGRQAQ